MRQSRIYCKVALSNTHTVELDEEATHYVARVLRLKSGDSLSVFNGEDGEFAARIQSVSRKSVTLQLAAAMPCVADPQLPIHLGLGLSRGERMDYAIQKATELGVSAITPLFTERCEVKLGEDRADKRLLHWQRIIISACEQSGRCGLPVLERPISLTDWLGKTFDGASFVLDHRGTQGFTQTKETPSSVTVLIGPEGGLSFSEVDFAAQQGFQLVRIGPRVLRTETAPVVALSLLQNLWGDF